MEPLGKRWIRSFLKRNPRVSSVVGRKIEASRIENTTPEQLQGFFDHYDQTRMRYTIRLEDTWNMDEVGIALGICSNTRVLSGTKKGRTYVKRPKEREWVTILEAISATGQKIRPLTVFKGKSLQTQWLPAEKVPDWVYATSENGWTSKGDWPLLAP